MILFTDLHSHSGYSGGVGQITLESIVSGMKLKGIDVFGTGDCLHKEWLSYLEKNLVEEKNKGLYNIREEKNKFFLLQTEVIFTLPYGSKKRKLFHVVVLFPDFSSVKKTINYIERIEVKNNIGRPFIKFDSVKDVQIFIEGLKSINPFIEIIPAHVMTPQGLFGSENPVYYMEEVFGEASKYINVVETGLSADPEMLSIIPELDRVNFISCSDCHSPALYRIGRELTRVEVENSDFENIITSLRNPEKTFTFEFPPQEGKFFYTGHRKGKKGHEEAGVCYCPENTPENNICPVCDKKLTVGVFAHLQKIAEKQGSLDRFNNMEKYRRKNFRKLVPLADVVKTGFKVRSYTKKVLDTTVELINFYGSEVKLWEEFTGDYHQNIHTEVLNSILKVKNSEFSFEPGYDGEYGKLIV